MNRKRKLFSSSTNVRRKLFSENEGGVSNNMFEGSSATKKIQCLDCGYVMETAASTTNIVCPKCGSKNRFNVLTLTPSRNDVPEAVQVDEKKIKEVKEPISSEEKTFTRRSLFGELENSEFQKEFSKASNNFEKNLKLYSGKTIKEGESEKLFSMSSEDMIKNGFARVNEDNSIKINESAFLQNKLFSKLIVSVTKVLDLNPICEPKSDIIDMMEEKEMLPSKGIMILKKAHSIPMIKESEFSNTEESEAWIKDSGIIGDLKLEFGNTSMGIKEFTKLLEDRYDDAPENIIDLLIEKGVIKIQGNQVDIMK